jgi:flagellar hook-length control protein FliK
LDISQVEKCITDALTQRTEQGTRQMSVRLVPEHLGDLHITIREEGKRLTIKIKASDESVQNVLNEKLSFISQNLKVRGVDIKEIELSGFSEEGSLSNGLLYRDNGEQGRAFEGDERYSGFFENPTDGKQEKIHTGQALSYVSADRVNILI